MATLKNGEIVRLKSGHFPITFNYINGEDFAYCTYIDETGIVKHEAFAPESLEPMPAEEVKAYYDRLKAQKSAATGATVLDKMVKIATIISPIALVAFTVVSSCNQKQISQLTDELNGLKKSIAESQKQTPKPK